MLGPSAFHTVTFHAQWGWLCSACTEGLKTHSKTLTYNHLRHTTILTAPGLAHGLSIFVEMIKITNHVQVDAGKVPAVQTEPTLEIPRLKLTVRVSVELNKAAQEDFITYWRTS